MTTPRDWKPGDPVGSGEVYLTSSLARRAYGREIRARVIAATPELERRRKMIEATPEDERAATRARVMDLWKEREKA